ncbi:uncharacterized protein LOC125263392 isoform X1 [Megalobrama amblycephala]|uniref:uncharacterized protein LOC125263392 isoform X1 n=1 Tax=Megalobrama amblycephala TaxID=75352 RepID=UPI0020142B80|nr:uncharacterized protein LOC125263392 isoform X1 [Megalobrama amblycephala]
MMDVGTLLCRSLLLALLVFSVTQEARGLLCYCERCVNRTCNSNGLCYAIFTKSARQIVIGMRQCIHQDQLYPPDRPFQCAPSNSHMQPYCCGTHMCNKNPNVSAGESVPVSVMEGDSVTLYTNLTEIRKDEEILWEHGAENSLIAQISRAAGIFSTSDGPDGRFRDRLKLDNQTGSLTITNTRTEHAGEYQLGINGVDLTKKRFSVSVYEVHWCGPTEAVIRLVLSGLVGVATVILLVYEIRSRRLIS